MRDIQYKSTACGPAGSFQPGDKRQGVPDDEAMALVSGGYAIDITPRATLTVPVREQAIPTLGEQAVGVGQPQAGRSTQRRGR